MNWVAVRGKHETPVRFCHFWEGRVFKTACPIPSFIPQRFRTLGSRYATHARVMVDDQVELTAWTFCAPCDQPERSEGRIEALKKLVGPLGNLGFVLLREDGKIIGEVLGERRALKEKERNKRREAVARAKKVGLKRKESVNVNT